MAPASCHRSPGGFCTQGRGAARHGTPGTPPPASLQHGFPSAARPWATRLGRGQGKVPQRWRGRCRGCASLRRRSGRERRQECCCQPGAGRSGGLGVIAGPLGAPEGLQGLGGNWGRGLEATGNPKTGQQHAWARGTGDKDSPSVLPGAPQCQGARPRARGLSLDAAARPPTPGSAAVAGLCLSGRAQRRGGSGRAPPSPVGANRRLTWKITM